MTPPREDLRAQRRRVGKLHGPPDQLWRMIAQRDTDLPLANVLDESTAARLLPNVDLEGRVSALNRLLEMRLVHLALAAAGDRQALVVRLGQRPWRFFPAPNARRSDTSGDGVMRVALCDAPPPDPRAEPHAEPPPVRSRRTTSQRMTLTPRHEEP